MASGKHKHDLKLDFEHMEVKASGITLHRTFRCTGCFFVVRKPPEKIRGADKNRGRRRQNMDWDED